MRESVREHIVDKAIELLETEGPKAFGQTRVARAAKVQQGHLTYYFPRKSDLVAAVLERFASKGREEFARAMSQASQLEAASLRDMFFTHARGLIKDKKRTRVLLSVLVETQDDPDLAGAYDERGNAQRRVVGLLIGRPPDDVDVDIVLAVLHGLGLRQLLEPVSAARLDATVDRLRDWLDALPSPKPNPPRPNRR